MQSKQPWYPTVTLPTTSPGVLAANAVPAPVAPSGSAPAAAPASDVAMTERRETPMWTPRVRPGRRTGTTRTGEGGYRTPMAVGAGGRCALWGSGSGTAWQRAGRGPYTGIRAAHACSRAVGG